MVYLIQIANAENKFLQYSTEFYITIVCTLTPHLLLFCLLQFIVLCIFNGWPVRGAEFAPVFREMAISTHVTISSASAPLAIAVFDAHRLSWLINHVYTRASVPNYNLRKSQSVKNRIASLKSDN